MIIVTYPLPNVKRCESKFDNMVMPNLRDIFFDNDFSGETTPELRENEEQFNEALKKAEH